MSLRRDRPGRLLDATERTKIETDFVRAFISPNKRARFLALTAARKIPPRLDPKSMKKRTQYHSMVAGLEHWIMPGTKLDHPSGTQSSELLIDHLGGLGAPTEAYVISMAPAVDGRLMPLSHAVDGLCPGDNNTTLVICRPYSLAYYYHGAIDDASALLCVGRAL